MGMLPSKMRMWQLGNNNITEESREWIARSESNGRSRVKKKNME